MATCISAIDGPYYLREEKPKDVRKQAYNTLFGPLSSGCANLVPHSYWVAVRNVAECCLCQFAAFLLPSPAIVFDTHQYTSSQVYTHTTSQVYTA